MGADQPALGQPQRVQIVAFGGQLLGGPAQSGPGALVPGPVVHQLQQAADPDQIGVEERFLLVREVIRERTPGDVCGVRDRR